MINILVPTDFSDLSKVSIRYAIRFANDIQGNVTLIHVINKIDTARAGLRMRIKTLEAEIMEAANEDMDKLVEEFSPLNTTGQELKTRIVSGSSFNDAVKKEAKRLKSGLIVMGTKGASGLKKYILGSNTSSILDVTHIPVLVIPERAEYKSFRTVVFATTLKHTEQELRTMMPYVSKFDTAVHIVHVTSSLKQVSALEQKLEDIVSKAGYTNVTTHVMVNKSVDEAIEHYLKKTKAELITTFTDREGFYDKLFARSITRKLAFHATVPLLAFNPR